MKYNRYLYIEVAKLIKNSANNGTTYTCKLDVIEHFILNKYHTKTETIRWCDAAANFDNHLVRDTCSAQQGSVCKHSLLMHD